METISWIINPASGNRCHHHLVDLIGKRFTSSHIFFTQEAGHAYDLARLAVEQGKKIVVAIGGDGTVQEVAKAVSGTEASLGMIPCGYANTLAKTLDIPFKAPKALEIIAQGKTKRIDLFQMNQKMAVGVAGVGLDAVITKAYNEDKTRTSFGFFFHAFRKWRYYEPKNYTITIDGMRLDRKALLVAIANTKQWGNYFTIAPQASVDDGYLDLVIIHPLPWHALIPLAHKAFWGTLATSPFVETFQGRTIQIDGSPQMGELDGEFLPITNHWYNEIYPKALSVITP